MSPPPTSIDGTDITGATIDGAEVTEITVDGNTVFAPGPPDQNDLHARYDATEISLSDGSPVSTWTDQTGNGHDLTAGNAPTYQDNAINGLPAVAFDGSSNELTTAFSTLSQPNTIFAVFRYESLNSGVFEYFYHGMLNSGENALVVDKNNDFVIRAGSNPRAGSADTNLHISSALYNSTSILRLDGSQNFSGSAGSDGLDGFRVGARESSGEYGEVTVGEILIYPQDKSGIFSDVENFLSGKWGISV